MATGHYHFHAPRSPMEAMGFEPDLLRQVSSLYNAQVTLHRAHEQLRGAEQALQASALRDPSFTARAHYAYTALCEQQRLVGGVPSVLSPYSDYGQSPQAGTNLSLPLPPPLVPAPSTSSSHSQQATYQLPSQPSAFVAPGNLAQGGDQNKGGDAGSYTQASYVSPALLYTSSPPTSETPIESYFPSKPVGNSPAIKTKVPIVKQEPLELKMPTSRIKKRTSDHAFAEEPPKSSSSTSTVPLIPLERPQRACRARAPVPQRERSESLSSEMSEAESEASSVFAPSDRGSPDPPSTKGSSVKSSSSFRRESFTSSSNERSASPKPHSSRKGKGKDKYSSVMRRQPRPIVYDPDTVFPLNVSHNFQLIQTKDPAEICERNCVELFLVGATADSSAPLEVAVRDNTVYGKEDKAQDGALGTVYTFVSSDGRRWLVTWGPSGPTVEPETMTATDLDTPRFLIHFNPGSMVDVPKSPVGSLGWWRVQACTGPIRHRGMPGEDGAWTARWDKESGDRRPARIVQHFATCKHSVMKDCPINRLARVVLAIKQR